MNRLWTDLSLDCSTHLQSFIISNPFSILVNIKQLKELKKQKKEQYENKEDDRASTSTTQDVEEVIKKKQCKKKDGNKMKSKVTMPVLGKMLKM